MTANQSEERLSRRLEQIHIKGLQKEHVKQSLQQEDKTINL